MLEILGAFMVTWCIPTWLQILMTAWLLTLVVAWLHTFMAGQLPTLIVAWSTSLSHVLGTVSETEYVAERSEVEDCGSPTGPKT